MYSIIKVLLNFDFANSEVQIFVKKCVIYCMPVGKIIMLSFYEKIGISQHRTKRVDHNTYAMKTFRAYITRFVLNDIFCFFTRKGDSNVPSVGLMFVRAV